MERIIPVTVPADGTVLLSVARLRDTLCLDVVDPWGTGLALSAAEIEAAPMIATPYEDVLPPASKPRAWHAGRVRYLARMGWRKRPALDVGADGWVSLLDGHHRLYAAWFRGDEHLSVDLSGFIDEVPDDLFA